MNTQLLKSADRGTARLYLVGGFLWGVVLTISVFFLLTGIGTPGVASQPLSDNTTDNLNSTDTQQAVGEVDGVSKFAFDGSGFDIETQAVGLGIKLSNIGDTSEQQSVNFESSALDEGTLAAANTGLCVIGMDENNPSGVTFSTDKEENSVNASLNSERTTQSEDTHPTTDTAEQCSKDTSD